MRNKYLATIYKGIVHKKNYKDIHQELYDMTINSKVYSKFMFKQAVATLNKLNKKIPKNDASMLILFDSTIKVAGITALADKRAALVCNFMKKEKPEQDMGKTINHELNEEEGKKKEQVMQETLKENVEKVVPIIFYLCSDHTDCAADHLDYQGKIYIHEHWKQFIDNKELKERIEKYVKEHKTKTVQWVMGRPVWLITRPNCRHYFKQIATEDVLHTSVKKLIEDNDMHREVGRRQWIQTLKHSTKPEWYKDRENAEKIYNKYLERLAYHRELYKAYPNDLLKQAITKDKILMKKWRDYLQSL